MGRTMMPPPRFKPAPPPVPPVSSLKFQGPPMPSPPALTQISPAPACAYCGEQWLWSTDRRCVSCGARRRESKRRPAKPPEPQNRVVPEINDRIFWGLLVALFGVALVLFVAWVIYLMSPSFCCLVPVER